MKSALRKICGCVAVGVPLVVALQANASQITGFESPNLGETGPMQDEVVEEPPTGFTGTGAYLESGYVTAEEGYQFLALPIGASIKNDPTNVTINELLGIYTPNTTFTLTYYVARDTATDVGATYLVQLFDGSTTLTPTSETLGTPAGQGVWELSTQTYISPATTDNAQLNLTMSVAGTGGQLAFDNVNLTEVAAPEPGSLCLLSLGAAGLLIRRRRSMA